MTIYECDGDCEKTCSGIQICPLLCEETCLSDEMDLDEYLELQKYNQLKEELL